MSELQDIKDLNGGSSDLRLDSYDYFLPEELIASRPVVGRHHSKLLVYNATTNEIMHANFLDLPNFLPADSSLVLNQSKVFPCRLLGQKPTGGQCEIFFLTVAPDKNGFYECLIKARGAKKVEDQYLLPEGAVVTIKKILDGAFAVEINISNLEEYLSKNASLPIPPYIRDGKADEQDKHDYQTVFADESKVGSVAAPTAGLHFTKDLFFKLKEKNIIPSFVTLHVGMGTFAPVKEDVITNHKMHFENYHVDEAEFLRIKKAKKVFAVGTTSLRVLESVSLLGESFNPGQTYKTNIFLHPGKKVRSIDGLITNFHLPKSTLLMLVSSLIGREKTLELYDIAIKNKYRFFSYGDAMLIIR